MSTAEISAIGTLRNVTPMISRVSSSTKPITSGSRDCSRSTKSSDSAASPPTAYSTRGPDSPSSADGARSERISLIAVSTRSSDSLNGIARVSTETVPSFETSTWVPDGRNSGDFSAAASTLASAAATSSCWEASARTTRSAVVPSDGNALLRSCMVLASGIELGRVSRLPLCVFMPSAGIASSTTTTVASDQRHEPGAARPGRAPGR